MAQRRFDDPVLRNVLALCAADFLVGLSFGAIAVSAHISLAKVIGMSSLIYAGGAQFLAVGLASAGAGTVAIVLACLLLNARHLPFGLAVGEVLDGPLWRRLFGAHLLTDESTAFALAEREPADRRRAYWLTGLLLFVAWNIAVVIGVFAGRAVGDPNTFGVDAAFPAALLALVMPSLKERPAARVALTGAVLALVATPFLPAGLPVLVALLALVTALPVPGKKKVES